MKSIHDSFKRWSFNYQSQVFTSDLFISSQLYCFLLEHLLNNGQVFLSYNFSVLPLEVDLINLLVLYSFLDSF